MGQIKDILLHSFSFEFEFARNPSFLLSFVIPHIYIQSFFLSPIILPQFNTAIGAITLLVLSIATVFSIWLDFIWGLRAIDFKTHTFNTKHFCINLCSLMFDATHSKSSLFLCGWVHMTIGYGEHWTMLSLIFFWSHGKSCVGVCLCEYLIDTLDKKTLLVWNRYYESLARNQSFACRETNEWRIQKTLHKTLLPHTPILPVVVQYIQWIKSLLNFFVNCGVVWFMACTAKCTPFHLWIVGFRVAAATLGMCLKNHLYL